MSDGTLRLEKDETLCMLYVLMVMLDVGGSSSDRAYEYDFKNDLVPE
jgi:hypothetical protein